MASPHHATLTNNTFAVNATVPVNLLANPEVRFAGREMHAVEIIDLTDKHRLELLSDRVYPPYAAYRSRAGSAGRGVPIIELTTADRW